MVALTRRLRLIGTSAAVAVAILIPHSMAPAQEPHLLSNERGANAAAPTAHDAGVAADAASRPTENQSMASAKKIRMDVSPWGMFLAADVVVKTVMIGLAAASFVVWTIWLAKLFDVGLGARRLRKDMTALRGQRSLAKAMAGVAPKASLARIMLVEADEELAHAAPVMWSDVQVRINSRLLELEGRAVREIRRGMSFLASVAATAPFIGLFGTVWGIMNSFVSISQAETTSLTVVAPNIAEALLATGIGLVAAIPAVILYNHVGQKLGTYKRLVQETRGEVCRIVSRVLEDQASARKPTGSLALAAE